MAALDEYDPERNSTFLDESVNQRLKKIDITLKKLTDFYKANVNNKHDNDSKAALRELKSSILKIRKGRKDMIDADNLISKTLGLSVVRSAIQNQQNYSPLANVSPNKSRPTSHSITRQILSLGKRKPKSKSKSKSKKNVTKKGGAKKK